MLARPEEGLVALRTPGLHVLVPHLLKLLGVLVLGSYIRVSMFLFFGLSFFLRQQQTL